jgi:deoxycytidylate deaminase
MTPEEATNMRLARDVASTSPCSVRVGAVLATVAGRIWFGYNAPPRPHPHATDDPKIGCDRWCQRRMKNLLGAPHAKSAEYTDCPTVHAETMVLALAGKQAMGGTLYVTGPPCMQCAKLIAFHHVERVLSWTTPTMSKERGLPQVVEYLDQCGITVVQLKPNSYGPAGTSTAEKNASEH